MPKQYLDDSGNPISAPAAPKQYLDDSGHAIGAAPAPQAPDPTANWMRSNSAPAPRGDPHPSDVWSGAATIGPAPKASWLDDAENDLKQGGSRTIVGRTLGKMQGRGDKGYTGLEAGVSKGTADFMGSPEEGAVETAKGLAKMKDSPGAGAVDTVKGLAHMLEIPGMVMGSPSTKAATEGAASAITKAVEALPTATRGGNRLNEVEEAAGHLPVEFQRTYEHLDEIRKLVEAGDKGVPGPLKMLMKNMGMGKKGMDKAQPVTYEQARRMYEILGNLSTNAKMKLSPNMGRLVNAARAAMKDDIGDTAAQVEKAVQYYGGMKDYARAMKAARIGNAIRKAVTSSAVKYGLAAAGAGAAGAAAVKYGKDIASEF